jgi:hypothetical protein
MFIHPNLREARPLMVVGGPRCGTRFVASALNRRRTVLLQGEIPWQAMDNAIRFLVETNDYFDCAPQWAKSWQQSRRALLYALWTSMVKGKQRAGRTVITWFGHKHHGTTATGSSTETSWVLLDPSIYFVCVTLLTTICQ